MSTRMILRSTVLRSDAEKISRSSFIAQETTDRRRKFRGNRGRNGQKGMMSRESSTSDRAALLRRASDHSPFLRDSIGARPDIADAFLERGPMHSAELALQTSG